MSLLDTLRAWTLAIRPKTLPAAVAPVMIGTAMAFGDGIEHWPSAGVAGAAALLIQIGTNFVNDYCDFKKGVDTAERIGPVRVIQAGLVTQKAMMTAIVLTFFAAALCCAWLVMRAGWPLAVIGALAIVSGILYTAGPCPLGYIGLGEVFVFIFFGPVAVAGTYYIQSFELNTAVVLAGVAPGLLASAILAVNNLRDIEGDRASGKMTLAARFGPGFARYEYMLCILLASLLPVGIYALTMDHIYTMITVVVGIFAIPALITVSNRTDGPSLNQALADTGKLLLLYSVLFSIGWVL